MKKSKVEDKQFYMTITAIIAIVAVVGLVIMFTGRGRVSTEVSEADMIGQAFRISALTMLRQVGVSKDIVTAGGVFPEDETPTGYQAPTSASVESPYQDCFDKCEATGLPPDSVQQCKEECAKREQGTTHGIVVAPEYPRGVVFGVGEKVPDLGSEETCEWTTIACECRDHANYAVFCSKRIETNAWEIWRNITNQNINDYNLPMRYLGGMRTYPDVMGSDEWSERFCGPCPDDVDAYCTAKAKTKPKCNLDATDLEELNKEATDIKNRCLLAGGSVTIKPRHRLAWAEGTCN